MNHFINLLLTKGFVRTNEPLESTLVVHAVAGAGKSTLIRQFLSEHPNARAYTHGIPDPPNLTGRCIQPFKTPSPEHFNILDEYCAEPITATWDVLIADPLQHKNLPRRPHYIKATSHRLGPDTCALLREVGIEVTPRESADKVVSSGIFEKPLYGEIISLDRPTLDLLRAHNLNPKCPQEVLGQEFPVVTVVSSIPLSQVRLKYQVYIALTRHLEELHVRAPANPHPASRPQ